MADLSKTCARCGRKAGMDAYTCPDCRNTDFVVGASELDMFTRMAAALRDVHAVVERMTDQERYWANELCIALIPVAEVVQDDGEHCDVCGRGYRAVYRVPNDVWPLIAPKPDTLGPYPEHQFGGLLCVECASRRARERGVSLYFDGGKGWWPYGMWPEHKEDP